MPLYLSQQGPVGGACTRAASPVPRGSSLRTAFGREGVKLPPSRDLCYTPTAAQLRTRSRQRKTKFCPSFFLLLECWYLRLRHGRTCEMVWMLLRRQ